MTDCKDISHRILSLYPRTSGFAYAVLEGKHRLADFGQVSLGTGAEMEFCDRVEELLDRFKPNLVVLEDQAAGRRAERARSRVEAALRVVELRDVRTVLLSPGEVRMALGLSVRASKHEVAAEIATRFRKELTRSIPTKRIWQIDPRIYVFEAVALALAAS